MDCGQDYCLRLLFSNCTASVASSKWLDSKWMVNGKTETYITLWFYGDNKPVPRRCARGTTSDVTRAPTQKSCSFLKKLGKPIQPNFSIT